jgi:NACalpha-BTF3-like transcription factor
MKKDAYYFPHFSNARHDRKIKRVSKELGIEGYGIYFMLLEVLREQPDLRYPMSDIDLLSDEFGTSEQKVRTVICNYQLFEIEDNQKFFSPKLIEYLQPYFKMKEQRRIAGEASAAKRMFNDRSTTVQQSKVKESKVKESKADNIELLRNRAQDFSETLKPYLEKYGSDMLNAFYSYWTEPNKSKTKMRFELEKTWDVERRLNTWASREKPQNKQQSTGKDISDYLKMAGHE